MKVNNITIRTKTFWVAIGCFGEADFLPVIGRAGTELAAELRIEGLTVTVESMGFEIAFYTLADPIATTIQFLAWMKIAARCGGFDWCDDEPPVNVIAPRDGSHGGIVNEALQTVFLSSSSKSRSIEMEA